MIRDMIRRVLAASTAVRDTYIALVEAIAGDLLDYIIATGELLDIGAIGKEDVARTLSAFIDTYAPPYPTE